MDHRSDSKALAEMGIQPHFLGDRYCETGDFFLMLTLVRVSFRNDRLNDLDGAVGKELLPAYRDVSFTLEVLFIRDVIDNQEKKMKSGFSQEREWKYGTVEPSLRFLIEVFAFLR
jgi:hypothetical protein